MTAAFVAVLPAALASVKAGRAAAEQSGRQIAGCACLRRAGYVAGHAAHVAAAILKPRSMPTAIPASAPLR